jgi:hypothetical protein
MEQNMSRVEILGQFNVDYPCVTSIRGKVQIDPSAALPTVPSNWGAFTESANQVLSPLTTLRLYVKVLGIAMYIILTALIVVFSILPSVLKEDTFQLPKSYNFVPFVAFVGIFLFLWIQMRIRLSATMTQLNLVCNQYSENSEHVKYELQSEHWGGCNKPHVRRYFILVHFSNDMEAAVASTSSSLSVSPPSSTVVPNNDTTVYYGSHPQQNPQQQTTTTTTSSFFDQLKETNL